MRRNNNQSDKDKQNGNMRRMLMLPGLIQTLMLASTLSDYIYRPLTPFESLSLEEACYIGIILSNLPVFRIFRPENNNSQVVREVLVAAYNNTAEIIFYVDSIAAAIKILNILPIHLLDKFESHENECSFKIQGTCNIFITLGYLVDENLITREFYTEITTKFPSATGRDKHLLLQTDPSELSRKMLSLTLSEEELRSPTIPVMMLMVFEHIIVLMQENLQNSHSQPNNRRESTTIDESQGARLLDNTESNHSPFSDGHSHLPLTIYHQSSNSDESQQPSLSENIETNQSPFSDGHSPLPLTIYHRPKTLQEVAKEAHDKCNDNSVETELGKFEFI